MIGTIEVTKQFSFEASHRLYLKHLQWKNLENEKIFGQCGNNHGHSFKLFVTVSGIPGEDGMVINFTRLGEIVNRYIINVLDHQCLNAILGDEIPLTCENVLSWMAEQLRDNLPNLIKLKLYETEKCFATLRIEKG